MKLQDYLVYEAYLAGYAAKICGAVPRHEVPDNLNLPTRVTLCAAMILGTYDASKGAQPDGVEDVNRRVLVMVPELESVP